MPLACVCACVWVSCVCVCLSPCRKSVSQRTSQWGSTYVTSEESYLENFIKHLFSVDMQHISAFFTVSSRLPGDWCNSLPWNISHHITHFVVSITVHYRETEINMILQAYALAFTYWTAVTQSALIGFSPHERFKMDWISESDKMS